VTFPLAVENQARIEASDTYLLFNNPQDDSIITSVSKALDVSSVVMVPFTHPDGAPMGYLAATYLEEKSDVSQDEAALAMGLARILQTSLLRELETQRRRRLSTAVVNVADSERRRLSRDIHDDPLQRLLAIRVGLEGFRGSLAEENHAALDDLINRCRDASQSLREVMLRTHPTSSELADLQATIQSMISAADVPNLSFVFHDHRPSGSPSYLVPTINRVTEQAARNALHHAGASELSVELSAHRDGTLLVIADDGAGFDPTDIDPRRLGLVSMRERTELLDGTFTIDSKLGEGTTISAWFPHREPSDGAEQPS